VAFASFRGDAFGAEYAPLEDTGVKCGQYRMSDPTG